MNINLLTEPAAQPIQPNELPGARTAAEPEQAPEFTFASSSLQASTVAGRGQQLRLHQLLRHPSYEQLCKLPPLANVHIDPMVPDEIKQIVWPVMYGIGMFIPARFNQIEIEIMQPDIERENAAETEFNFQKKSALIEIDIPEDDDSPLNERQGRIAQTLTHEIFLHATPFFQEMRRVSSGEEPAPEFSRPMEELAEIQHRNAYLPMNSENSFLHAIRLVLPNLPSISRHSFLSEYINDIENLVERDCIGSQRDAALNWTATLKIFAENPDHQFWRQ